MNIFTFIFLICLYALFNIYQVYSDIELEKQILYSSIFILAFGIPHGAIDHILFFKKKTTTQLKFYSVYLGLILAFLVCWLYLPMWSFMLFLFISAFHFGESQLEDISIKRSLFSLSLYSVWGLTLLTNLIYYNINELSELTAFFNDTETFNLLYESKYINYIFITLNSSIFIFLSFLLYSKTIKYNRFFSEIFLIALIHLTFYLFPFIIGFSLYFVVLHSLKVMSQEFHFFKKENQNFNLIHFLKLLSPYSSLSIFFTVIILWLSHIEFIPLSMPLTSLIIISAITLPHAIVMHIFYNSN